MPQPHTDTALLEALRRHRFDFGAAAVGLGLDADDCRLRWVELDKQLSSQVAQETAADESQFLAEAPSGFNILQGSLGISEIFEKVKDHLPSMPQMEQSDQKDEPVAAEQHPLSIHKAVQLPDAEQRGAADPVAAAAHLGLSAGAVCAEDAGQRSGGRGAPRGGRAASRGRGGGRGGRGLAYARDSDTDSDDDGEDDADWMLSRRTIKKRGTMADDNGMRPALPLAATKSSSRPQAWDVDTEAAPAEVEEETDEEEEEPEAPAEAAAPASSATPLLLWQDVARDLAEAEAAPRAQPPWKAREPSLVQVSHAAAPDGRRQRVQALRTLREAQRRAREAPRDEAAPAAEAQGWLYDADVAKLARLPALPAELQASGRPFPQLRIPLAGATPHAFCAVLSRLLALAPFSTAADGPCPFELVSLQLFAGGDAQPTILAAFDKASAAVTQLMLARWLGAVRATAHLSAAELHGAGAERWLCAAASSSAGVAVGPPPCLLSSSGRGFESPPPLPCSVLLVKAHALRTAGVASKLLDAIGEAGLELCGCRSVHYDETLSGAVALGLDSPLLPKEGLVLALLVRGWDVSERLLSLAGPADPSLARRTDPESWRAIWGEDRLRNVCSVCRHQASSRQGRRCAAFFFGSREEQGAERGVVHYALATELSPVLLILPEACDCAALLSRLQRAGLALHTAARVERGALPALQPAEEALELEPGLVLLLSREGAAPMCAAICAQLPVAEQPVLLRRVPQSAVDLLWERHAQPAGVDMYKHLKFVLSIGCL